MPSASRESAESSSTTSEEALGQLHIEMKACRQCLAAGFSVTSDAVFSGSPSACLMIVGQAPGSTECETGRPFSGPSGQRLFEWLTHAGWGEARFRATQYMTAITKCYPGRSPSGKGDRAPTRAEQKLCAPFLDRELALVRPEVIVPVGSIAVRRFLGQVRLTDVVGTVAEDDEGHIIVPLPHPSGVSLWLNRPKNQERVAQALAQLQRLCKGLAPERRARHSQP